MSAMSLRQLVPSSLLAGRWIAVLVCYLDDSGKDPQSRVTTVAGYVARETAWAAFETAVEPIFNQAKVNVLHAKDLEDTDGDFKNWKVLKKQSFVARVCRVLSDHSMLGVSMSAVKQTYAQRAKESSRKRTVTPYSFCLQIIIDWLLRDVRTGRAVWNEGLALILECGHENNPEAEEQFCKVRKLHQLDGVLRSISFVSKTACRAIQMADLFAFYSRRDSAAIERAATEGRINHEPETMLKIITERGQFRGFVAADFGPDAPGSYFLAGDPG
jgi:hypothetical protein